MGSFVSCWQHSKSLVSRVLSPPLCWYLLWCPCPSLSPGSLVQALCFSVSPCPEPRSPTPERVLSVSTRLPGFKMNGGLLFGGVPSAHTMAYPSRVYVLEVQSLRWQCWTVLGLLRDGAQWEVIGLCALVKGLVLGSMSHRGGFFPHEQGVRGLSLVTPLSFPFSLSPWASLSVSLPPSLSLSCTPTLWCYLPWGLYKMLVLCTQLLELWAKWISF